MLRLWLVVGERIPVVAPTLSATIVHVMVAMHYVDTASHPRKCPLILQL